MVHLACADDQRDDLRGGILIKERVFYGIVT